MGGNYITGLSELSGTVDGSKSIADYAYAIIPVTMIYVSEKGGGLV
jgi:hypothetical protein